MRLSEKIVSRILKSVKSPLFPSTLIHIQNNRRRDKKNFVRKVQTFKTIFFYLNDLYKLTDDLIPTQLFKAFNNNTHTIDLNYYHSRNILCDRF